MTTQDRGTAARLAILRELDRRETAKLPAPTFAQLATLLGISSPAATKHIARLKRLGWVTTDPTRYRSLALTDTGRDIAREL